MKLDIEYWLSLRFIEGRVSLDIELNYFNNIRIYKR
jgi:hypothetical protein